MARVGINPARSKHTDYRPAGVTLAMLTYIPDLCGYFNERLKILELVLESLHTNTTKPYDLMIFDNNSCPAVQNYLRAQQSQGLIDYLIISSQNIGKIGALRILFEASPGDIIAYTDDDILFYPGWLEAHLEILEHFPKVGMVSGTPVRNAAGHAHASLDALRTKDMPGLSISQEQRIEDEWEADWASSTGRNVAEHITSTSQHMDAVLRIESTDRDKPIEAIGSANHYQFLTPKKIILEALPREWSGKLMGQMIELDEAVDKLGYLRLSTPKRYTRHLGNVYSTDIFKEAQTLGLETDQEAATHSVGLNQNRNRHWTLRVPGMRRIYMAIYQFLFDVLYR